MKGTVKIMGGSGHAPVEYDTEVPESVEVAREAVERELGRGARLFALNSERRGEQVGSFKPGEHESLLVVPPIAGG